MPLEKGMGLIFGARVDWARVLRGVIHVGSDGRYPCQNVNVSDTGVTWN